MMMDGGMMGGGMMIAMGLVWLLIVAVLVLSGSALALTAAIGVVRFPDTLSRMHAASKPQVLGLLLVLAGGTAGTAWWFFADPSAPSRDPATAAA